METAKKFYAEFLLNVEPRLAICQRLNKQELPRYRAPDAIEWDATAISEPGATLVVTPVAAPVDPAAAVVVDAVVALVAKEDKAVEKAIERAVEKGKIEEPPAAPVVGPARRLLLPLLDVDTILAWDPRNDPHDVFQSDGRWRWLCQGQSLMISAETGTGKSSLLMMFLSAWAAGLGFCGMQPKKALRIIYVQSENNLGDCWESLKGATKWVAKQLGVTEREALLILRENIRIVSYVRPTPPPPDPETGFRPRLPVGADLFSTLSAYYEEFPADMIILDPLTSFFEGDISKDPDARAFFYEAATRWQMQFPEPILVFTHHFGLRSASTRGKGANDWSESSYAQKGSTTLADWFRATINISRTNIDGTFKLFHSKRGGRRHEQTWFITQDKSMQELGLMAWDYSLKEPTNPVAIAAETREAQAKRAAARGASEDRLKTLNDIFNLLPPDPFSRSEFTESIALQMDASKRTISRYIQELVRQSALVPAPDGMLLKSEIEFELSPPPAVNLTPTRL